MNIDTWYCNAATKQSALAFFLDFDIFGSPIPTFTIAGHSKVRTVAGSCASIMIFALTLVFGLLKLQHLLLRKNPLINTNIMPLPMLTTYDTNQAKFKMAVSAESYDTGAGISDPRYVRWVVSYVQRRNNVFNNKIYPMHKCHEEEFAELNVAESEAITAKVKRL